MDHSQFFFTLFCTVFFCLGYSIVSSKGNLLHFLRKPFEAAENNIEQLQERIKVLSQFATEKELIESLVFDINLNNFIAYIGKPLITCITCTASIWGATIFVTLNGFTDITYLIINCFCASFIQTFIYKLHAKLD